MQNNLAGLLSIGIVAGCYIPGWAQEASKVPTMMSLAEHARVLGEAEKGDPIAAYIAGEAYLEGKKVGKNTYLAQKWLLVASEAGIAEASNKLAWMYVQGNGVAEDPSKAASWFKTAADQGDRESLYQLGWMYENGRGVPQDFRTAADWYRRGADAGDEDSMACLGWLLENGMGVEKSPSSAVTWYEKAAQEGSAMAMNNLAWLLIEGRGTQKNLRKGVELIQDAARRGHPRGEGSLAKLYENGLGLEKNLESAREWWDRSAQHGDLKSIRHLAHMYFTGDLWPRDVKKAISYARLGAKSERDPECFGILGGFLSGGKANMVDDFDDLRTLAESAVRDRINEAIPVLIWCRLQQKGPAPVDPSVDRLFELAAQVPRCQSALYTLTVSLDHGIGGITDRVRASNWETALAAAGFPPAKIGHARRQLQGEAAGRPAGFASMLSLAKDGEFGAAFELGKAYEEGLGTERSKEEALRWYRESVDRDYPPAFLEVARVLHSGRLGLTDLSEAARLYRRFQALGFPLLPDPFKADGALVAWEKVKVPDPSKWKEGGAKPITITVESFEVVPLKSMPGSKDKNQESPRIP